MSLGKNKKIIFSLVITLITVVILIWMFKPNATVTGNPEVRQPTAMGKVTQASNQPLNAPLSPPQAGIYGPLPALAPSLQGTEIDCPLQVDKSQNLILNSGIRTCFDYFLSSLGEKTEIQLVNDIQQYLSATLPASAATYAKKLLGQYMAYKHALSSIQPPQQNQELQADSMQRVIIDMSNLQRKFFSSPEMEAFFGNETAYNEFSVQQLKINSNPNLTTQQKAEKVGLLLAQMPPVLADSIRPVLQYNELQELTKAINAEGGSAADLRAIRESLVGSAAADRLEKVDREEISWKTQVDSYLATREQIQNSSIDTISKQREIEELRNRSFRTPEDRLRVQTFEQIHDTTGSQKK